MTSRGRRRYFGIGADRLVRARFGRNVMHGNGSIRSRNAIRVACRRSSRLRAVFNDWFEIQTFVVIGLALLTGYFTFISTSVWRKCTADFSVEYRDAVGREEVVRSFLKCTFARENNKGYRPVFPTPIKIVKDIALIKLGMMFRTRLINSTTAWIFYSFTI